MSIQIYNLDCTVQYATCTKHIIPNTLFITRIYIFFILTGEVLRK